MPDALWQYWPWTHLAGRVLFSLFCLIFGFILLLDRLEASRFLEAKGISGARPVALAAGFLLAVGGAMILTGWHRFIGPGLVFLVLFPGAWAVFPFWNQPDRALRRSELVQFFMMLALAGSSLFIAVYGFQDWPFSIK